MSTYYLLFGSASVLIFLASALAAPTALPAAEQAAVFKAAGYKLKGKAWRLCDTGKSGAPSTPGSIQEVRDLNGDGLPEAVVTEESTFCYGNTGTGYTVVSKLPTGSWKAIAAGVGIPNFLATKGAGGWPDIEVGGPSFCFPVMRWNGSEYKQSRYQYEGKPCRPR